MDDFIQFKTKDVVQTDDQLPFIAIIDGKPIFPLLGFCMAHIYAVKHIHEDPTYNNPFGFVGYLLFHLLGSQHPDNSPANKPAIETMLLETKKFLDASFVLGCLIALYERKPRPPQVTLVIVHTAVARLQAKPRRNGLPFPILLASTQIWIACSLSFSNTG
ncbi:hypothetical protein JCM11251_006609 [Rhodosporidiobolus azoricus]